MKSTTASAARKGIDFTRIAQDFKGLDPNEPGLWPAAPRVAGRSSVCTGVGS